MKYKHHTNPQIRWDTGLLMRETKMDNKDWSEIQKKQFQEFSKGIEARAIFYMGGERVLEAIKARSTSDTNFWYSLETYIGDLQRDSNDLKYYKENHLIKNPEAVIRDPCTNW